MAHGVIAGLVLGALVSAQVAALATPVANGTGAAVYTRDCRSAAARAGGSTVPDRCIETDTPSFAGTFVQGVEVRRPGTTSAAAYATHPLAAHAGVPSQSTIDAAGTAGVLTLRQGAFTGAPYARVSGHSLGLQSFFYDGSGPTTRTLVGTLDFIGTGLMSHPEFQAAHAVPAAYGYTQIDVFSLAASAFDFDDPGFFSHLMYLDAAAANGAGFRHEGRVFATTTGGDELTTRLDVTLEAGRWYFVNSYLGLWAKFDGQFDATHTFTTELGIVDAATGTFTRSLLGLTPAAPSVPEPASLALVAAGVLAAAALVRRRSPRSCEAFPARATALR